MKAIGNTPLIRLRSIPLIDMAEIWVKWEGANPTGSMKDRMALSMIQGAERSGKLMPGGTVVDYTGGSTGSSLAMVCAAKGYKAHFVSSDAFAESKLRTMRAFGATVEVVPSVIRQITPELIQECFCRVDELKQKDNTFWTDQFNNVDNRSAYHAMAQEVLNELGPVDGFVAGVGTGGCFSGTSERLKDVNQKTICASVEPANSRMLSEQGPYGGHRLEGIGAGFKPGIYRDDLANKIFAVTDEEAFETTRRLAKEEGLFGGISSGANLFAAMQLARELGPGKKVVTVVCDSGLKYLDGDVYQ